VELKGWATRLPRQNDCVGTDAFVRPASEASVRTIPVAVEERRFSAAMILNENFFPGAAHCH